MIEITTETQEAREREDKPTASDIVQKYWTELSKNWNLDTADAYWSSFDKIILPQYLGKPLEEFTCKEDYEEIVNRIQAASLNRRGKLYMETTINKFRYLMRRVLEVAADHGVCLNVLWGTNFYVPEEIDPDKEEEEVRTRLHKSLQPDEEFRLAKLVFLDPLQTGEEMFVLLMWSLGGRPNEIADIQWKDIYLTRTSKYKYAITLFTSVDGKVSSKIGGKTPNMYRIVPISKRLYVFLMKRKQEVERTFRIRQKEGTLPPGIDDMEDLFICCAGNNYYQRCDLRKARNNCRDHLRQIGVKESLLQYYEREAAMSNDIKKWGSEKSVTSYILRRNFCTHLFNLNLTEEEILYLMGHSMKHVIRRRSEMRFPAYMEAMWDKMAFRPIMNPYPDWNARAFVVHGKHDSMAIHNIPQQNIIIEPNSEGGDLTITVTPNEADDHININIEVVTEDGSIIPVEGFYKTTYAHGEQQKGVNIVSEILRIYRASEKSMKEKYVYPFDEECNQLGK